MVSLPELKSYNESEREFFFQYSPVLRHYFNLSKKSATDFEGELRILKHQQWLKCAFAVLSQKISTQKICEFWTEQTELLLKKAWEYCDLESHKISLLAFGKLGSRELNLSSDIDIVFVHKEEKGNQKVQEKVKNFIQILSKNSPMGFCYRVDMNLRPGGNLSPLVSSEKQFFNYFDEYTEAWTRLGFVRMRLLTGPDDLNKELNSYCRGLAFPRYLDFSVVEDIKGLRSRIEYQWKKKFQQLDIKFHPGGIRDIELYIQSLQVIYGGRKWELQCSSITSAMKELKKTGILHKKEFDFFHHFYWYLRHIENLIQVDGDRHTYILSHDFFDKSPLSVSEKELIESLIQSHELVDRFFISKLHDNSKLSFDLKSLNNQSQKAVDRILNIQSQPLKKGKLEEKKKRVLNKFLEASHKIAIDENMAVQSFKDFILAIRSKSSIFYLLDRNSELLENLAWLFSISPYIGQTLCCRPSLIDGFVLGHVEIHRGENIETLIEDLVDYKWLGHLVAVIYFLKKNDIEYLTNHLSKQADTIALSFLGYLKNKFRENLNILCMGKWSGFELGIHSDLDFIFLVDEKPNQTQMKMAKRFIHLISSMTNVGKLYNVDLRLKPGEADHLLLLSSKQLFQFLENSAQPWQKQAYLRSRLLGQENPYFKTNMNLLSLSVKDIKELDEIQGKLFVKNTDQFVDIKYAPGGLIHCELTAQKLALLQNSSPQNSSTLSLIESLKINSTDRHQWIQHYLWLRRFEQTLQICNHSPSTKVLKKNPDLWKVGKILKINDPVKALREALEKQSAFLKSLT